MLGVPCWLLDIEDSPGPSQSRSVHDVLASKSVYDVLALNS